MLLVALVVLAVLAILCLRYVLPRTKKVHLPGSHVLITGGSSGIGKCLAEESFRAGANVTLLARDVEKLKETQTFLLEKCKGSHNNNVQVFSIDITKDFEEVKKVIHKSEESFGPIDILVNSAGFAVPGTIENIQMDSFKKLMDLNYFGSLHCTKATISGMKDRRRGRVVFISSQAGQCGMFGYSGYSASKFALRGLAESLQMEVSPYDVRVCVAYPPDTKTPGFDEENKSKPLETTLISAGSGIYDPPVVAKKILEGVLDGKFSIHVGLEGMLLSLLTCGMSPATDLLDTFVQIATMGLLRAVAVVVLFKFDRIVSGVKEREKSL